MYTQVLNYSCKIITKREGSDGGEHNVGQLVHQPFLVSQSSTSVMVSLGH